MLIISRHHNRPSKNPIEAVVEYLTQEICFYSFDYKICSILRAAFVKGCGSNGICVKMKGLGIILDDKHFKKFGKFFLEKKEDNRKKTRNILTFFFCLLL